MAASGSVMAASAERNRSITASIDVQPDHTRLSGAHRAK